MKKKKLLEKTVDVALTKEGMSTIGGAAAGGWIGSSVGIAALGTAVAGTLPIAAVGGLVGYLAVKAFSNKKKEQLGEDQGSLASIKKAAKDFKKGWDEG
ncbi:hypothetical protein N8444_03075 [Pelagibacteraceae bacterium]|nr:hypothetical protein [Pelagibacteraceae bacterium]